MGEAGPDHRGRRRAYAHSVKGRPPAEWEPLDTHLAEVALGTAWRACKFGCGPLGEVAGALHDFGKFKRAFQLYLANPKQTMKGHSAAGAVQAFDGGRGGVAGRMVAHVVAGHHAGLQDGRLARETGIEAEADEAETARAGMAEVETNFVLPTMPAMPARGGFASAFLIRMLFSCLIDADRACTRAFYVSVGEEPPLPERSDITIVDLSAQLTGWMGARKPDPAKAAINASRDRILAEVRSKADRPQGVFTLTVPTGGGKTLTGLDFALRHAEAHGLDRIIVVIPFTSVIEQTAEVYREALGPLAAAVLEHHSTFDEESISGERAKDPEAARLAMEDWDSRIVVTTAVQFFESLFSNRPTRCRKLHNIARSVVILDEAQTMPLRLLRPCVAALRELAGAYGTTVVLSTATQPALLAQPGGGGFEGGFPAAQVTELAPDVPALFEIMRRVTLERVGKQDDAALAERLAERDQALCIVNTRRHARELFRLVADMPGARHLSTLMHAAHRSRVLAGIKQDLDPKSPQPCRVVSTSLIEAGVDVDFPLVMRAEVGLDQVAQSAGRLNRSALRPAAESRLLLFKAAGRSVPPDLEIYRDRGAAVIERFGEACLGPEAIESYFSELYWGLGRAALDKPGVLNLCETNRVKLDFPFATIAAAMQLIDSPNLPIIVADDAESQRWLAALQDPGSGVPLRTIARGLQRYTVGLPPRDRAGLITAGAARFVRRDAFEDGFLELVNLDLYDSTFGLDAANPYFRDAAGLVV